MESKKLAVASSRCFVRTSSRDTTAQKMVMKKLTPVGFTSIQPKSLPPEIQLIPLGGHTIGHTGVAVHDGDRWLLHCGDAYYYHQELENTPHPHPLLDIVQTRSEVHHDLRLGTQARLRELVRNHGDEVSVFSAHDPWEFERYRAA